MSDISFVPDHLPLQRIPLVPRPQLAPIQPHTLRGLSPNTPAKRLFGSVAGSPDPDVPIPSIEDFSRPSTVTPSRPPETPPIRTPYAPGAFPRSSSVLIHRPFVREESSADPITIIQPSPQQINRPASLSKSINPASYSKSVEQLSEPTQPT